MLQVSANGVISFNDPFTSVFPLPFPLSSDDELIAPYWAHADITSAGTVFYRETDNSTLLSSTTIVIGSVFPQFSDFFPTTLFIATWDGIGYIFGGNDRVRHLVFTVCNTLLSYAYT